MAQPTSSTSSAPILMRLRRPPGIGCSGGSRRRQRGEVFSVVVYDPWEKAGAWLPGGSPSWRGALSLDQLTRRMTRFDTLHCKGRARCWSPIRLRPLESGEYRRRNALVDFVSCLVVDLDNGGISRDALRDALGDVYAIYHSTYSSTPATPKGRAIMPLSSPCPVSLWPRMWQWVEQRLGADIDRACKDPARVFYLPSHPVAGHCESWVQRGALLEVDYISLPMTSEERKVSERRERKREPVMNGRRELWKLLKTDERVRRSAAIELGARIMGQRATAIQCPGCGRPGVWFVIDGKGRARCNHVNSCGGEYWLDQLLESRE